MAEQLLVKVTGGRLLVSVTVETAYIEGVFDISQNICLGYETRVTRK